MAPNPTSRSFFSSFRNRLKGHPHPEHRFSEGGLRTRLRLFNHPKVDCAEIDMPSGDKMGGDAPVTFSLYRRNDRSFFFGGVEINSGGVHVDALRWYSHCQ
jgi:hypothetical protein